MQDINFYQLLHFFARKWRWIISITAIAAMGGYVYNTYVQTPMFKSDATLLVVSTSDRKVGQDSTLINNYVELLTSRRVLDPVIEKQNLPYSYDNLVGLTSAENQKDTEVIKVAVTTDNAETSRKVVDGVVRSFAHQVKDLYGLENITVVDNASLAEKPYNVHPVILTLLAGAVGFALTITGLFFAYDIMSQRGTLPSSKKTASKKKAAKKKATKKTSWSLATKVKMLFTDKQDARPVTKKAAVETTPATAKSKKAAVKTTTAKKAKTTKKQTSNVTSKTKQKK